MQIAHRKANVNSKCNNMSRLAGSSSSRRTVLHNAIDFFPAFLP